MCETGRIAAREFTKQIDRIEKNLVDTAVSRLRLEARGCVLVAKKQCTIDVGASTEEVTGT